MPITLKPSVDSLDGVPEAHRANYKQDEATKKFHLQEITIPDPVDVTGIVKSRDDVLKEKKALEAKYAGIDPELYKKMADDQAAADKAKLEGKGQWEVLQQQLVEAHQKELDTRDGRTAQLQAALETRLVDAEAVTAIAAAGGVPELLLPHVKRHIKVFEEDGEFVAKVVDAKGSPRIGDTKGTPMTIAQLVEEMKATEVFGRAFNASGAGGSGASSNGSSGGGAAGKKTMSVADWKKLTPKESTQFFKDGGTLTEAP